MKLLLSEIDCNVKEKLDKLPESKTKDYILPEYGASVTEVEFINKLKLKSETLISKTKDDKKSKTEKSSEKRKLKVTTTEQLKGTKKIKQTGSSKKTAPESREHGSSQTAGPSKENCNWTTMYELDSESANSENDDANCIICGKFVPPGFQKSGKVEILDWGKCDVCHEWVHSKFCTGVVRVLRNEPFQCPKCC